MRITIDKYIPPKYTNTFVLFLTFMSGDADGYETKELKVSLEKAELAATFLTKLMELDDNGGRRSPRCLGDNSKWKTLEAAYIVDGFYHWRDPKAKESFIGWGMDSTCEGENASLDKWHISWFDENGKEFNCKVSET
jgi:hypothetical protein